MASPLVAVGTGLAVVLAFGCGGSRTVPPAPRGGALAGASLVLITIDTLRADRVGAYGSTRNLTPALDQLAQDGIRFDAAVAQVPLTLPSHATILTGLHPARHGVRTNDGRLAETHETLATQLKRAGYATAAFIAAFPLERRRGLARGFDLYDDGFLRSRDAGNERPAGAVVEAALAWLGGLSGPRFAWVHLFDPHTPYRPPEPFGTRFAREPYDGEVAYTDAAVGHLLEGLRAMGLYDTSLIVVVADHGEGLGDHGERTHGVFLYDATIRVPLLMRVPGGPAGRVVETPVETSDLAPTLLGWLVPGAAAEARFDGRSLAPLVEGQAGDPDRPAYTETYHQNILLGWSPLRAVRTQHWKYIEAPVPELYDLRSDPEERANLAGARQALARGLAAALPVVSRPDSAVPMTAEVSERLRSLGYVVGRTIGSDAQLVDPKTGLPVWRHLEDAVEAMEEDPARAEASLRAALRLDPRNGMAFKYLGDALARQQRINEAVVAYRRAVANGFEHPDAFLNLGTYARRLGRAAEARAALERGVALDPTALEAWNELGILRAESGDPAGARTAFEAIIAQAPERAEPYYNLALLDLGEGNSLRAREHLDAAIARAPGHANARAALGTLELLAHRPQAALNSYEAALAADPDHLDALLGAARAAREIGRTTDAIAYYERFAAAAPPARRAQARAARREAHILAGARHRD